MPRNGRIRLVGKREAREAQERDDELKELERALRREWREHQAGRRNGAAADQYDEPMSGGHG